MSLQTQPLSQVNNTPVVTDAVEVSTPKMAETVNKPTSREIVRRILARRYAPGQIIELRVPGVTQGDLGEIVYGGLYTDHEKLIEDIAFLINKSDAPAIYTGLQEIKSTEQYQNLVTNSMKKGSRGAEASDIERYRWLLIDVDTIRQKEFAKSSSTDAEKAHALAVVNQIVEYLKGFDVAGDLIDSGNSYHIVSAIDLPATEENEILIQKVLESLAAKFNNEHAVIDTGVYDRPRICKLPGTIARKGNKTEERPHRWSGVISEAEPKPISLETLLAIADLKTVPTASVRVAAASGEIRKSADFVRDFLEWGEFEYQDEKSGFGSGILLPIKSFCPFEHKSGHHENECSAGASGEAKFSFRCQHDSCTDVNGWKEFRAKVEELKGERYSFDPVPVLQATGEVLPDVEVDPEAAIPAFDPSVITGIYAKFVELICRGTTLAPQFAFVITKTVVGALMAGKVKFKDLDAEPRIYAALIGKTGSGKGEAWRRMQQIVKAQGLVNGCGIKIINSADSGVGIKESFFDEPLGQPILCYIDEIAGLGNKASSTRNPSIIDAMIELADSTSVSRVLAKKNKKEKAAKTRDDARFVMVMCGQNGDVYARALAGRTELGIYDRFTPEHGVPVEPGKTPEINKADAMKLMVELLSLNYQATMEMSPEADARLEAFWHEQQKEVRVKARRKRDLQLDSYMTAFGDGRTIVSLSDVEIAIKNFTRQLIIRQACFGTEISDRVSFYLKQIKQITERMREQVAAGIPTAVIAQSRRDYERKSHASRYNEEHIFERAWLTHSKVHLDEVKIKKSNGQVYRKFVPKPEW